jgi:hypothetical protein
MLKLLMLRSDVAGFDARNILVCHLQHVIDPTATSISVGA